MEEFTRVWLKRAKRTGKLDDGDRFISLWIAFNGWMRGKFGENEHDNVLIGAAVNCCELNDAFVLLRKEGTSFQQDLEHLGRYRVANMKYPHRKKAQYTGDLGTLLDVIYSVRNNLFHGRKDMNQYKKDFKLVTLSYRILLKLFEKYYQC